MYQIITINIVFNAFTLFPRDLANLDAWKPMFDPYKETHECNIMHV